MTGSLVSSDCLHILRYSLPELIRTPQTSFRPPPPRSPAPDSLYTPSASERPFDVAVLGKWVLYKLGNPFWGIIRRHPITLYRSVKWFPLFYITERCLQSTGRYFGRVGGVGFVMKFGCPTCPEEYRCCVFSPTGWMGWQLPWDVVAVFRTRIEKSL